MKPFTIELEIALPRDRVVELFDNPDNLAKWQPGLQSFEHISGEPGHPGAKSRLVFLNGNRKVEMVETITLRNLPDEFNGTYEFPGGKSSVRNRFIELGPNRTMLESTCRFELSGFIPRLIGFLLPGIFRRQNQQFLEKFKAFAEGAN